MLTYVQNLVPYGSVLLSALVAAIPIFFFFFALIILKLKAYKAGFLTTVLAIVIAFVVYGMPLQLGGLAALQGALYGFFPIGWIVTMAVFLYNLTLHTGQFDLIKQSISSITDDRRLQVLLISFCFGAFLEGAAGFGTPVAITAAILIGLGFEARYAACLCLLANTAPVAFGGLGIPVIVGAQITGISLEASGKQLAFIIPVLGIIVPFYLVTVMSGWKGLKEVLPATILCAFTFTVAMFATSYYLGPILPDIVASIASLVVMAAFLRVWKPKNVWRFPTDAPIDTNKKSLSFKEVLYAWSPFLILITCIGAWGSKAVKGILSLPTITFAVPVLHNAIINPATNSPIPSIFKFDFLATAGTSIFVATILASIVAGVSIADYVKIFKKTISSLKWSLVTIATVLAFAYVGNAAGLTITMGKAIASTGTLFPFLACIVGWIGVFVTGSDTSANALFGKLQTTGWQSVGSSPVMGIGANLAGGGVGKMISPQSIAIAAAATGLEGKEDQLYRFSLRHSVVLLLILCTWTYLLYNGGILESFVVYDTVGHIAQTTQAAVSYGEGIAILAGALVFAVVLTATLKSVRRPHNS